MANFDICKICEISKLSKYYKPMMQKESSSFKLAGSWHRVRDDWWFAFVFFLDQAYYTGRSDELSQQYENATVEIFDNILGKTSEEKRRKLDNRLRKQSLSRLMEALKQKQNKNGKEFRPTGRDRDLRMVKEALDYAMDKCEFNIVKHSISSISNGKIDELYNQLNLIFGIGQKVASLFLESIVFFYELDREKYFHDEYYQYTFPVDTWIEKIYKRLGNIPNKNNVRYEEIKKNCLNLCLENRISPIDLNHGMWYLGSHAFEVILDII